MGNFFKSLIILLLFLPLMLISAEKEVRGVWFAWAGSDIPSRETIIQTMEELADANFNVVYVDVWRFGYPYFRSEVFFEHTGLYTDPSLPQGRDVLQEMIIEGHRVGLEVDAWFESGFSACTGSNDDLYDVHPAWFAEKQDGSVIFISNGGIEYKWLSHCNRDAQQFLIDLAHEVADKYEVDGVEFDRVRYPELDCGYDSATVELYQSEHGNQSPPADAGDPGWIQWRADKLTEFVAMLYDSIKAVNPHIMVSNAPLPWGYEQFCQDYPPWIDNGYLDHIATQMYYTSNDLYSWRVDMEMQKLASTSLSKLYPGISTVANGSATPASELVNMINTTRNNLLDGNVTWYSRNLIESDQNYLAVLKSGVYSEKAELPYRNGVWRPQGQIIHEDDTTVVVRGIWNSSSVNGFENGILINEDTNPASLEYRAEVPFTAWFDLFVFNVSGPLAAKQAVYTIYNGTDSSEYYIDQTNAYLNGWQKLTSVYLQQGQQTVVKLSNRLISSGEKLTADAVMLMINRKRSPEVIVTAIDQTSSKIQNIPEIPILEQNYPNPFNPKTAIGYRLSAVSDVNLSIFNMLGQKVATLVNSRKQAGHHVVKWNAEKFASGIYLYKLQTNQGFSETRKMILIK